MDFITTNISDWWGNWFTAHYDPFYLYCAYGALIVVAVSAASWYFPVLRSLAGAIVFTVIAALTGYRRGESDEAKRERAAAALKKKTTPTAPPWKW